MCYIGVLDHVIVTSAHIIVIKVNKTVGGEKALVVRNKSTDLLVADKIKLSQIKEIPIDKDSLF